MTIVVTLLLAFVVVALMMALMGVGVMAGRKPLQGSCGGLNGRPCEICTGTHCKRRSTHKD